MQAFGWEIEYLVVKSCRMCLELVYSDGLEKVVLGQNDDFTTKNSDTQKKIFFLSLLSK